MQRRPLSILRIRLCSLCVPTHREQALRMFAVGLAGIRSQLAMEASVVFVMEINDHSIGSLVRFPGIMRFCVLVSFSAAAG